MRTKRPNKSELSALIAKQYEVLAQHAHERRPILEFLGKSDRPPITAQELAHRRPGADPVEDQVLLRRGSIHMDSVIAEFREFGGETKDYKIVRPINGFDNRGGRASRLSGLAINLRACCDDPTLCGRQPVNLAFRVVVNAAIYGSIAYMLTCR